MARPKPLLLRILQNPNFYAILVGGILVSAAFYIFLNQRAVGRQVTALLHGHFLMSKEAGDPNDPDSRSEARSRRDDNKTAATSQADAAASDTDKTKETAPTYSQMEIAFFELSRENLMALAGKILRDEGDWHVVFYDDAKTIESLQGAARKLPGIQEKLLQKDSGPKENTQMDAGDVEPDLQAPYLAVGVEWIKNENLHWALDLQLPPAAASTRQLAQAENAAANGEITTTAAAAPQPLQLTTLEGTVHFTPQSALLLVYDPAIRTFPGLEPSTVSKSPLRVLASDDFRAGYSALVVWIRLK